MLIQIQLTEDQAKQQASAVIGRFVDCEGKIDVSENHDAYLDEAYSA
ncbi:MAG TPA: hypothetical protein VNL35_17035 [Chloroflexota bacterium]|nr:hypothetical protein [Chloroflexota bacterium]